MAELRFKNRSLSLQPYETVLDCLLRSGEAIPYACKAGMCQACLIRAVDCEATAESRKWIKPNLQAKGYTLACQWVPEADVAAALPGIEEFSVAVRISELAPLNERVLRVRLQPEDPARMFAYRPGQYLTLINPEGCVRSYSIANDYERDGYVELHIASTTHGEFSGWIFSQAHAGTQLHMRGPAGDGYYSGIDGDGHPLLLAGTATGLLHGRLEPLVESGLDPATVPQTRVFLCGAPDFVYAMRKRLFLKGLRTPHIHCDPFTEREVVNT